jgi:UDP:flavonoid glycosyltransferase YjiC (YdhE family)
MAVALRRLGAEVTIATIKMYEQTVKKLGFTYVPVGPHFRSEDQLIIDAITDPKMGTVSLVTELLVPGLSEAYREIESHVACHDVTVTHPVGLAAMISSEIHAKPWVATVLAPVALFSRYDAPFLPICPMISGLARHSPFVGGVMQRLLKQMAAPLAKEVGRFRSSLGLRGDYPNVLIGSHSPYLNLALFDDAFGEPQRDWPQHTVQTGACMFEVDAPLTALDRRRLDEFLANGDAPVIVTLGSSAVHFRGDFFAESYQALAALKLRALFISGDQYLDHVDVDPTRFLQMRYLPYSDIFPAAKAIINHGGIGTLSRVLRAGKPTLVVPFSHDQPDNAERIRRLGVGLTIPAERYDACRAKVAIDRLVHEPSFSQHATQISSRFSEGGAARAAHAIYELAGRRTAVC